MAGKGDYVGHVNRALRHLEAEARRQRDLAAAMGHRVKVMAWQDVMELCAYANHHADQFLWQPDLFDERSEKPRALLR